MGGFFCFDLLPLATPALPTRRVNYSGRPAKPLEPCSQGEPQPWITSIISTDLQRLVHSAVVYAFIYGDDFGMTYRYQTQRLRGGRVSITGQVYLVTCTTRHRYPHFANHLPATGCFASMANIHLSRRSGCSRVNVLVWWKLISGKRGFMTAPYVRMRISCLSLAMSSPTRSGRDWLSV